MPQTLLTSPNSKILNKKERVILHYGDGTGSWPEQHKPIIAAIESISLVTWEGYLNDSTANERKYQRKSIQEKAQLIAETATHLASEGQNEQGWRLNLEHHIVGRFRSNIECLCQKRVWVCDFEPPLNHFDKNCTRKIQQRRDHCKVCSFNQNKVFNNEFRISGTPPLFVDVAGAGVRHDSGKSNQPDRVFGLRITNEIKDLLPENDETQRSALMKDGSPLVYQFLMLESKSDDGDGFLKAYEQSALPLQSFLQLQNKLQAEIGVPKEENKSLVWFLAHRGEDWRILAAYTYFKDGAVWSVVVPAWEGNLMQKAKALQLLLAIDFIYDWARDVYRENVIAWLKNATSEIVDQNEILSRSSTNFNQPQVRAKKPTNDNPFSGPPNNTLFVNRPARTSSNSDRPSKPPLEGSFLSEPKDIKNILFNNDRSSEPQNAGGGLFGPICSPVSKILSHIDHSSKPQANFSSSESQANSNSRDGFDFSKSQINNDSRCGFGSLKSQVNSGSRGGFGSSESQANSGSRDGFSFSKSQANSNSRDGFDFSKSQINSDSRGGFGSSEPQIPGGGSLFSSSGSSFSKSQVNTGRRLFSSSGSPSSKSSSKIDQANSGWRGGFDTSPSSKFSSRTDHPSESQSNLSSSSPQLSLLTGRRAPRFGHTSFDPANRQTDSVVPSEKQSSSYSESSETPVDSDSDFSPTSSSSHSDLEELIYSLGRNYRCWPDYPT